MNFLAGVLIKTHGYNFIIKISIIMNIVSFFMILKMIPNNKQNNLNQFVAKSFKEIITTSKILLKEKPIIKYLVALYGILVFFVWQFGSIASMILLDMNLSGSEVAIIGSIVKICTIAGTIISLFFLKNTFSLVKVNGILLIIVFFGWIGSITYNLYIFCLFMMIIDFVYVILEISIEKNLEFLSNKTIRGTAISVAMTFCNLFAVICNLSIGFIAQYINYRIGLIIIITIMLLITIFCFKKIYFQLNK